MNEAAMSGAVDLPEALTRRERLELAWALVWPCALFDLVYSVILTQLRLSESQRQNWEEAIGIVWFFLFSTWVVRRTVRLEFTGFHLEVFRDDAMQGTRTMSYRESLSVAWLICWRSVLYMMPFILIAIVITIMITGWAVFVDQAHATSARSRPIEWVVGELAGFLIVYFWVARAAVVKRYARFSLGVSRAAAELG